MKTLTNNTWKKIAAFALSLTLMCGAAGVIGNKAATGTLVTAAASEETNSDPFVIMPCGNGELRAELVEGDDQEFNAILVTPVPDKGFKLDKLYADGQQVAINDKDEYLIAYTGETVTLSADFVEENIEEFYVIEPSENGEITAAMVEGDDQEFDAILVTATPAPGYKLDKVFADGEQVAINDKDEYLIAYNGKTVTLSAEFVEDSIDAEAFDIVPSENGSISAQLVEGSDQEFNAILVTPNPDKGFKLDKLFANGEQVAINDKGEYLIAYKGDKITLSAEFVKASYTITVKDGQHGKVKADKAAADADEAVLITATPDSGYKVDKVLVNGQQIAINDKGQYLIAMPAADITVTAEFVADAAAPAAKGDSSPKTGAGAAVGLGAAAIAAAAAVTLIKRRK